MGHPLPHLRMILAEQLQYWAGGSLQDKLDCAFKDFQSWCRTRKIPTSQPAFTVKMVLWFYMVLSTFCLV